MCVCVLPGCVAGEGILAIKAPWPSMMRTVYGDHERFQQTYFSAFKGYYFTGEGGAAGRVGKLNILQPLEGVVGEAEV